MKKCAKYICLTSFRLELSHVFWKYIADIWFDVHLPIICDCLSRVSSRLLNLILGNLLNTIIFIFGKKKNVSMYNLYTLQKREMIFTKKCQVVRHNNNNKSFQISSKIPHYYYPSVAKPLTTLKVICQIIFCILNDVSLASALQCSVIYMQIWLFMRKIIYQS